MNAGIRFGLSVALLSANLTGCASVSEETSRAALNAFIAVRPNVELHDLEIGVLSFWNNPRSALSEVDSELSRHRRRIHEEAVGVLARAKLIVEADLEELNEYFVEIDIVGHAGLTIPSLGRIYLREDYAADVAVLVHEIAHVATERQGYPDKKNTRFFLRPGGRPDPRFFDLDAFVAEKMLSEAEAEATERIAMAYRDDGSDGVESF